MKTIITSTGNNLSSKFDLRFGRCSWFCLYDEESGKSEFFENKNLDDGHGAGTKAAEQVFQLGAKKVISGDFGPKAKDVLEKINVQMVILEDQGQTIREIIKLLK